MTHSYLKSAADVPAGYFATEAAGLRWLEVPGGPAVAAVHSVSTQQLVLQHIDTVAPTRTAAKDFGTRLATLHAVGGVDYGQLPPGATGYWFGPLAQPLPITMPQSADWGVVHAARLTALAHRLPEVPAELRDFIAAVAHGLLNDDTPPARVHGDLWSGNLLFGASGAVLIDPAAYGGHPYVDLAMLEMFGAPHLTDIISAWQDAYPHPTPVDFRARISAHQVFGLLGHAVLFGGRYLSQTVQASTTSMQKLRPG